MASRPGLESSLLYALSKERPWEKVCCNHTLRLGRYLKAPAVLSRSCWIRSQQCWHRPVAAGCLPQGPGCLQCSSETSHSRSCRYSLGLRLSPARPKAPECGLLFSAGPRMDPATAHRRADSVHKPCGVGKLLLPVPFVNHCPCPSYGAFAYVFHVTPRVTSPVKYVKHRSSVQL